MEKQNAIKASSIAIVGLLLVSGFGMFVATVPQNVKADTWWHPLWLYRNPVGITNPDSVNFLNTSVQVSISPGNAFWHRCLSTGHDIRFIAGDDLTGMSYYREYWNYASERATFWVHVSNFTASATTHFWMYYGNTLATADISNGANTFEMYDNFEYSNFRNVSTNGFSGNAGGTIYQKAGDIYQPNASAWSMSQQDMMGISMVQNSTTEFVGAYGSHVNASYTVILGIDSTTGYNGWTDYDNILVNHSATDASPDFLKACEPHFLTNMTNLSSTQRAPVTEYSGGNYCMYYSGLNSTNYSINLAYASSAGPIDSAWTKLPANPVLKNSSAPAFDSAGVRSPVTWRNNAGWYSMLYAGCSNIVADVWGIGVATSADMVTWTKNYTFSVFNGSSAWGWDNCSVFPQDIQRTQDGIWWEMLYTGIDWEGNARLGIAYTSDDDLMGWVTWAGILGIGEGGDYDDTSVRYGSWNVINSGRQWLVYDIGTNSTGIDMLGMNNVFNSTLTGGGAFGLQNDGSRQAGYHITTDGVLKVWWNGTMLAYEVDYANYSTGVEFWTGSPVMNVTIFQDSTGDSWASSEDYYGATIDTVNGALNTSEFTAGTCDYLNGDATTIAANFSHQLVAISRYGNDIATYSTDFWEESGSSNITDSSKTSGEIGLRMDRIGPVYFDNFRTTGTSNGTVITTLSAAQAYSAPVPDTGGDDTGDDDIVDDTPIDEGPADEDENLCCGSSFIIGSIIAAMCLIGGAGGAAKFFNFGKDGGPQ